MINQDPKEQDIAKTSDAASKKLTQDYPNLPATDKKQNPPDIDKEDITESSEIAGSGKTDNTEETSENGN